MAEWLKRVAQSLAGAFTVLGAIACGASAEITEIPAGALVVDVRTAAEFGGTHFPGAINVPVQEIAGRASELGDKGRPIVVYCRSGHRSAAAKAKLVEAGFTAVIDGGALGAMMRLAPGKP